jgi:hypothetical protein
MNWLPGTHLAVDEAMIAFRARTNHKVKMSPLRARGALVCSMASQWDDGFTPSRGIRCEVAGDARARRR